MVNGKSIVRKNSHAICFVLLMLPAITMAQVPDDINGRLWRLCKVWGFLKYFHENQCSIDWNESMLIAIDSVLESSTNASFNSILEDMLTSAGNISPASEPLLIDSDINLNADFNWIHDSNLNDHVQKVLDSIVVNFRPRENCFASLVNGYLDFNSDLVQITNEGYNNEANRLLVFFHYWNIINYFYPYRYLMDVDWDSTLYHFMPLMRQASSDQDFHLRFLDLVTRINDSHGVAASSVITSVTGSHYPLLGVSFIEGKWVVTKVHSSIIGIAIGDILLSVDGIDINILQDSLSHFTAASNEPTLNRNIEQLLLKGQFTSQAQLELVDKSGIIYTKSLTRLYTFSTYFQFISSSNNTTWKITECGYGYVNMANLYPDQLDQMYAELRNTPAIIFDVRNYPNGVIWPLIPYLFPSPVIFALFTRPDPNYPGWFYWHNNEPDSMSFTNPDPYQGKVIILVNAITQSHAEYTVMGLQQHPKAYTIGSQTAGADGNVTGIYLPGNIYTRWTGLGVYYPDTICAQRVGVKIDTVVTPTIEGILQGRDEVLEAAFDCLTNSIEISDKEYEMLIYPNPVKTELNVNINDSFIGNMVFTFFNDLGQIISESRLEKIKEEQSFALNVRNFPPGNHTLVVKSGNHIYSNHFIVQR